MSVVQMKKLLNSKKIEIPKKYVKEDLQKLLIDTIKGNTTTNSITTLLHYNYAG